MVGIQGISEIYTPANLGSEAADGEVRADLCLTAGDDLAISDEAQKAGKLSELFRLSEEQAKRREEEIARAQENLNRGAYRVQRVVLQVAARLSAYVAVSMD